MKERVENFCLAFLFVLLPLGMGGKEDLWFFPLVSFLILVSLIILRKKGSFNLYFLPFLFYLFISLLWSESPHYTLRWSIYFTILFLIAGFSEKITPEIIKPSLKIVSIILVLHYAMGGSPYLTTLGRASGTFFHPNAAAGFLLLAGVLSVYPVIDPVLFLLSGAGIACTGSRFGILIFIISILLTLFMKFRGTLKNRIFVLFLIIFTASVFLFLSPFRERLSPSIFISSFNVRVSLWKDTISAILKNPVLGYGYGSFEKVFPLFQKSGVYSRFPHSFPLELLFSVGLAGSLLLLIPLAKGIEFSEKWRLSIFPLLIHSLFDFSLSAPVNLGLVLTILNKRLFRKENMFKFLLPPALILFSVISFSEFFMHLSRKNTDNLKKAILYSRIALSLSPLSAEASTLLSNLYLEEFRRTGEKWYLITSSRLAGRAVRLEKKHYAHWLNLGTVYLFQDKIKDSLECFTKAIELYPQYPKVYLLAAKVLSEAGREIEAYRISEEGISLEGPLLMANNNEIVDILELYLLKGQILKKMKMYEKLSEVIEKSVRLEKVIESKGLSGRKTSLNRSVKEVAGEIEKLLDIR